MLRVRFGRYIAYLGIESKRRRYPSDLSVSWEPGRLLETLSISLTLAGRARLWSLDKRLRLMRRTMRRGEF